MSSVKDNFSKLNKTDILSSTLIFNRNPLKTSVISSDEKSDTRSNYKIPTQALTRSHIDNLRPFADFEMLKPTIEELQEMSNESEENGAIVNGRPSRLNDIMMLECPFYRCSAATIVTKHTRKTSHSRSFIHNAKKLSKRTTQMSPFESKEEFEKSKNEVIVDTQSNKEGGSETGSEHPLIRESEPLTKDVMSAQDELNDSQSTELEEEQADLGNKLEINVIDSIVMTVLQIINCIIKYTLVQIAFCIKVLGLEFGVAVIGIIAIMSIYSVHMLMSVHKITKQSNYLAFSERMFGQCGKLLLLILNFFSAYGSCLSYIIIFLKIVPNVIRINLGIEWISSDVFICVGLAIVLMYYCYRQDVSGIKKAAYWGFIGIILFFILTIIDFLYTVYTGDNLNDDVIIGKKTDSSTSDIICAISCLILSFSFHVYTFSIYDCMGTTNMRSFLITASVGVFISMSIYLIVGTIGYMLYSNKIVDSILDSIGEKTLNTFLSLANMVNVIMTFPITFNALKHYYCFILEVVLTAIRNLFRFIFCVQFPKKPHQSIINKRKSYYGFDSVILPDIIEYLFVIVLFVSIFSIAISYPSLKMICSLLGGTTANIFSFVFPAMFYIRFSDHKACSLRNLVPFLYIVFGLIGMFICIASTIISSVKS